MRNSADRYFQQTFDFLDKVRLVTTSEQLKQAISDEIQNFGFEHITIWTLPSPGQSPLESVLMNTRPKSNVEHYVSENYAQIDPVVTHLNHSLRPYSWSDVKNQRVLSKKETAIMEEAKDFDVCDGLVIPIITFSGTLSLVSPCGKDPDLSDRARTAIELMGIYSHQALKRFSFLEYKSSLEAQRLTAREREVLHWIAKGKTDDEISDILHISKKTVQAHMENTKAKLGVYKRTCAVIEAFRRGELSL